MRSRAFLQSTFTLIVECNSLQALFSPLIDASIRALFSWSPPQLLSDEFNTSILCFAISSGIVTGDSNFPLAIVSDGENSISLTFPSTASIICFLLGDVSTRYLSTLIGEVLFLRCCWGNETYEYSSLIISSSRFPLSAAGNKSVLLPTVKNGLFKAPKFFGILCSSSKNVNKCKFKKFSHLSSKTIIPHSFSVSISESHILSRNFWTSFPLLFPVTKIYPINWNRSYGFLRTLLSFVRHFASTIISLLIPSTFPPIR